MCGNDLAGAKGSRAPLADTARGLIRRKARGTRDALFRGWAHLRQKGPGRIQVWYIALLVGIAAGGAAVLFRHAITRLQTLLYSTEDIRTIHSFATTLPWWVILIIPICGGLVVGQILTRMTADGRVRSVADVIEGAALKDGRVEIREGLASALASWITLSSGGSTGREGPVVHLAGVLSTWVSDRMRADGLTGRDLLGCAVAAAVSASFNAPIAGALFAMEVVLRHFAFHAFAPIVIASAVGTVIGRLGYGDFREFPLPGDSELAFYAELPAFLLLGLVCGLIAVLFMRTVFFAEDLGNVLTEQTGLPPSLRPAVAGAALGLIAIAFPHIIGVGYETTSAALDGGLALWAAILFVPVKIAAVAITMAGRMGGGVFSPSLMLGALTGLAFGLIAVPIFPEASGAVNIYALAGMGAVAAAVLGAPISTTLIVFELSGNWQTGLAVMVSVSMSTALASRLVDRSFFLTQLERRGVHLAAGPQAYLLSLYSAGVLMRGKDSPRAAAEEACRALVERGVRVSPDATLEVMLPLFEQGGHAFIPVVAAPAKGGSPELMGAVFQVDALKAYNRALAQTAAEEHG